MSLQMLSPWPEGICCAHNAGNIREGKGFKFNSNQNTFYPPHFQE